jgi:hypothetical protein
MERGVVRKCAKEVKTDVFKSTNVVPVPLVCESALAGIE